ncbi:MAG: RnfABCDGE type electron transport complex subunit D [Sulfuritalea sp.]|jgi:hypothetical protein|nr:RnfABCDGE type electron transport complex subunit D [Sulfuritalea sp.]
MMMMMMRIIIWHIPLAMLTSIAVPALILHAVDPARYLDGMGGATRTSSQAWDIASTAAQSGFRLRLGADVFTPPPRHPESSPREA